MINICNGMENDFWSAGDSVEASAKANVAGGLREATSASNPLASGAQSVMRPATLSALPPASILQPNGPIYDQSQLGDEHGAQGIHHNHRQNLTYQADAQQGLLAHDANIAAKAATVSNKQQKLQQQQQHQNQEQNYQQQQQRLRQISTAEQHQLQQAQSNAALPHSYRWRPRLAMESACAYVTSLRFPRYTGGSWTFASKSARKQRCCMRQCKAKCCGCSRIGPDGRRRYVCARR